jgi:hypothetical protein
MRGISSSFLAAPCRSSEVVGMSSPSTSESDFEDAVSSTTSLCCASGSCEDLVPGSLYSCKRVPVYV